MSPSRPEIASQDSNGPGNGPGNGQGNGEAGTVDALSGRLEVIEQYVRQHDRTIRRALKIAAQFLDGQRA